MKRLSYMLSALLLLAALPAFAQEKQEEGYAPPKPIEDDFCKWLIGDWQGWGQSPMGKTQESMKMEWGLDQQFVLTTAKSKMTEMSPEQMKAMAAAMGMSEKGMEMMKDSVYKGMGPMTMDPKTGEFVAFWFDNWRGVYQGKGKRQGNKLIMKWEGTMGTSTRTIERVSDDKMVLTYKEQGPTGQPIEGRAELTRKKVARKY